MSRYMDNNTEAADSRSNAARMNVENPYQYNYITSPKVDAGSLAGGTPPLNDNGQKSELSYMDDNAVPATSNGNQADSRAKNTNTFIELTPADASPNEVKNFSVDDFLTHQYIPADVTNNIKPNMSGLYGARNEESK